MRVSPRLSGSRAPTAAACGAWRRSTAIRAGNPTGPVVVIDNYDSFTYNLCQVSSHTKLMYPQNRELSSLVLQYLGDLGCEPLVFANDQRSVQQIRELRPAGVLVSPGPGTIALLFLSCPLALGDSRLPVQVHLMSLATRCR